MGEVKTNANGAISSPIPIAHPTAPCAVLPSAVDLRRVHARGARPSVTLKRARTFVRAPSAASVVSEQNRREVRVKWLREGNNNSNEGVRVRCVNKLDGGEHNRRAKWVDSEVR